MTQTEKISHLKSFKNEKEFRSFFIDLLKKMGFDNVQETHKYGTPELGKDIVAKIGHKIEGVEWFSFVVKYGKISGTTNEIETVKNQIKQSFEYPFLTIEGEIIRINKVKVVTNESFSTGAQKTLRDSADLKKINNFSYWWNEPLIELIDKYYIDFWTLRNYIPDTQIQETSFQVLNHQIRQAVQVLWNMNNNLSFKYLENNELTKNAILEHSKKSTSVLAQLTNRLNNQYFLNNPLKQVTTFEAIDIVETLTRVIDSLKWIAKVERNLKFTLNTQTIKSSVYGNHSLLSQVFYNLLENAIKFSQENCDVQVTIKGSVKWKQKWQLVQITNIGTKILNAERESIFNNFYRGKEGSLVSIGSGVGLYISKQIIKAHGGEIELSKLNPVTFSIYLPKNQPK